MAGQATATNENETFVIALLKDGVRRFDSKEDAPEDAWIFSSIEDLKKMSIEELDKISGLILKAPISASKSKDSAVDRAWTAMLAVSATPTQITAPKKGGNRGTRVSNTTFKLVYDFDSPSDADAEVFKNLPPQAQTCLKIMARGGKTEYPEAELRKLVEDNQKDLNTRQEPWRIFQYYRNRLSEEGMIKAA